MGSDLPPSPWGKSPDMPLDLVPDLAKTFFAARCPFARLSTRTTAFAASFDMVTAFSRVCAPYSLLANVLQRRRQLASAARIPNSPDARRAFAPCRNARPRPVRHLPQRCVTMDAACTRAATARRARRVVLCAPHEVGCAARCHVVSSMRAIHEGERAAWRVSRGHAPQRLTAAAVAAGTGAARR